MLPSLSLLALASLTALANAECAADNCLRALRATQIPGRLASAQAFCATYTTATLTGEVGLPTYAVNNCKGGDVAARVSSACSCIAPATTSSAPATTTTATSTLEACGKVSSSSAVQAAATATPTVDAALAYECLNSVPLNKTAAIALVDAYVPYLEFQSDLAYLKDPPSTYFYPPHDVLGKLATIRANLVADKYANEYAFQADLYQVFAPAHDGHFVVYPDLLSAALEFGRQLPIVSVSLDGKELPKIYAYEDIVTDPSTASPITQINGEDAATYVANFAYTASYNQDADSAYNSMFFEKAYVAGGTGTGYFSINGRVRYIYPGPSTSFTFENGTSYSLNNVAHVKASFAGVTDGESFYTKFCTGQAAASTAHDIASAQVAAAGDALPGYPDPVIITGDGIVSGYYLTTPGFEDVAVLAMLAMENEDPSEFQAVVQNFIAGAKADGKTKIVIDVQANGGGYILQGYDVFRQFFPQILQRDYTRFRENAAFDALAEVYSASIPDDYDPNTSSGTIISFAENWWNYRYDYNLTEQHFPTFESKFAPEIHAGDPYTALVRWDLNDPLTTVNTTFGMGMEITGYGSRKNFTQPFETDNIVILYDGVCASTCILFSEFMIHDAGVKTIAMGGRPQPGLIQGMGGVKGGQSYDWGSFYSNAQFAIENGVITDEQKAILSNLTLLPVERSTATSVNLRDIILPDEVAEAIPAQFVAEESDCRLFWTPDMITDVTKVWEAAASAAFDGSPCAYGGFSKTSKRSELSGAAKAKRNADAKRTAEKRMEKNRSMRREVTKTDLGWQYGRRVIG
ncbi:peptidase s41 family protein [Xylogone sp. PMI_703]|nr:peptidase s41 family protein [Xylogone sp. PMI_703]